MDETKSSKYILQVSLLGEQPNPNVDERYILLVCILEIHCLVFLFENMLPLPDFHIITHVFNKKQTPYNWN